MMPTASAMFVLRTETADQVHTGDAIVVLSSPLAHRPLGCIHAASALEATHDSVRALISQARMPDFLLHSPALDDVLEEHLSCGPTDCVGPAAVQGRSQFWTLANAARRSLMHGCLLVRSDHVLWLGVVEGTGPRFSTAPLVATTLADWSKTTGDQHDDHE